MTVRVSVVVATYNRARLLPGVLEALGSQELPSPSDGEIVVVDNNSSDATPEVVASVAKASPVPVRYAFEGRQGLSNARNRGVAEARGAVLAFTDDDVLPAPDWLARILEALDRWNAQGVGGRILPRWEVPPPCWVTENWRLRRRLSIMDFEEGRLLALPMERTPQVWGANMAFRRELLERVGGFDSRLGMAGARLFRSEEFDLIERALGFGFRIAYDPAPTVYHRIGPDRLKKSYFRRLEFDSAFGDARAARAVDTPSLFGAPRSAYRHFFDAFRAWVLGRLRREPGGFDQELLWRWWAGTIAGSWSRNRGRPRA
jgi:glycosyltransferase involved in cell wall biosynthesis